MCLSLIYLCVDNIVQAGKLRRELAEGFLEIWEEFDPLESL